MKLKKTDTLFRIDRIIEIEIANTQLYSPKKKRYLINQYGEFSSNYRSNMYISTYSRLDIEYTIHRLGHFLIVSYILGYILLHKLTSYMYIYLNKLLIFTK